jgi:hypothetical protein
MSIVLVEHEINIFRRSYDKWTLEPVFGLEMLVSRLWAFDTSEPCDTYFFTAEHRSWANIFSSHNVIKEGTFS